MNTNMIISGTKLIEKKYYYVSIPFDNNKDKIKFIGCLNSIKNDRLMFNIKSFLNIPSNFGNKKTIINTYVNNNEKFGIRPSLHDNLFIKDIDIETAIKYDLLREIL